jgi:hypothetical protein
MAWKYVDNIQSNGTAEGVTVQGVNDYGKLSGDPTGADPAVADGDTYYNTTLDMLMRYDGTRAKWLSVDSTTISFGRSGTIIAGTYFRTVDGLSFSAALGHLAAFDGTVVASAFTKGAVASSTINITADGSTIASYATGAAAEGKDTTLNGDFSTDEALAAQNDGGGANLSNVRGWFRIKWRSP